MTKDSEVPENNPIRFAIIGGGRRAQYFLRIAREASEQFEVSGVFIRDAEKRRACHEKFGFPMAATLDELLQSQPSFVVVAVAKPSAPVIIRELVERGIPVLAETPPAPDEAGLVELYQSTLGAKIQVAEQYHLQPHHAARLAVVDLRRLGTVSQAQISVAHGYHGISLIRKFLGTGEKQVKITARQFKSPIMPNAVRDGSIMAESIRESTQTIATFDFGDQLGIFDFTGNQYSSWIRSPRVLIRGERGEINNFDLRYLKDSATFIHTPFLRHDAGQDGNLEGYYHRGITIEGKWVYRNPFPKARLSDEEIAIASCLVKMSQHVAGAPGFYSLAEAAQDQYLALMMEKALESGEVVQSTPQVWTNGLLD